MVKLIGLYIAYVKHCIFMHQATGKEGNKDVNVAVTFDLSSKNRGAIRDFYWCNALRDETLIDLKGDAPINHVRNLTGQSSSSPCQS